ncbi:MFS transporter [Stenotrophomonas sp. 24(2023)]|uniref:MFS transporter n=1 Tax=Stenotrophomonas sp. 24(2023) TaxID=3068324 RepID=UPI0027E1BA35|nr:MFS transporter [Stenotrophomonas sp. 24(2023)]WMJ69278.1 MFS transporter [Stenotrophomonas sp. 24(2023)]
MSLAPPLAGTAGTHHPSRLRAAAAVLALSLGCFTFVSTELMPVGVLPAMAQGLGVSLGAAGYLVSCFAFVVALTAAPLTGLLGRLDRRMLMAALLAVCGIGNLITCLAPGYATVLAGRVLVAAAIGVFWSTAVVTAVHLVSARNAIRTTAIVFGGVSLATVLGVPAGTLIGDHAGWRAVFAALSVLSLAVFAVVTWSVPAVRLSKASLRHAMGAIARDRALLAVFSATALIVTGNFLAYTYITPWLAQVAGVGSEQTSLLLLVYGAAGVAANFAAAPLAARALHTGLAIITALMAASLFALALAGHHLATTVGVIACWGAAYGALPVLLQTLVFRGAARLEGAADAATAINVAVFNAAIGLGALIGGQVINASGPARIPVVAAVFVLVGLAVVHRAARRA